MVHGGGLVFYLKFMICVGWCRCSSCGEVWSYGEVLSWTLLQVFKSHQEVCTFLKVSWLYLVLFKDYCGNHISYCHNITIYENILQSNT